MTAPSRLFVVGCPRSGTTLFQSLVASHPSIASCSETFFFLRVVPAGRIRRSVGLAAASAPSAVEYLRSIGIDVSEQRGRLRTVRAYAEVFTRAMDGLARSRDATMWLEKTPAHLRVIDAITAHVEGASFVHVIRSGLPTVTSLYQVTNEHPDRWDGPRSLERCVNRWNTDIRRSERYVGRTGHTFVSYERLCESPSDVLRSLFETLGVEVKSGVEAAMHDFGEVAATVSRDAPWKATVGEPIADRNALKVSTVLTDAERRMVASRVLSRADIESRFPFL